MSTDPAPRTGALSRRVLLLWGWFPAVVLVTFVVLVVLDISGSSIALLSDTQPAQGLLLGQPRAVRSDEFLLQTPIAISSVDLGFPLRPWIGLSQILQAGTAHGGPTWDWTSLFRPQDWGYLFLGASRGLAFNWWWSFAISAWGSYALLGLLTRSPWLAATLATAATVTPYAAWWSSPPPSLFVGYAAALGALLLVAWSVRRRRWAVVASVGGAASLAAFAFALYPPWQVTLAWVIGATCLGVVIDRRLPWRRVGWTTAIALVLGGAVVAGWFVENRAAIDAVAATYYPGGRVSVAGGAQPSLMLSAPLNWFMAEAAGATLGKPAFGFSTNLSEAASSWLPLPVVVLVVAGAVVLLVQRRRRAAVETSAEASAAPSATTGDLAVAGDARRREPVWTLLLVSVSGLLLLAWSFLPLPGWFGTITLLSRVPPSRTPLALGMAVVVLLAVAATVRRRVWIWSWPWLVVAAGATGLLTVWSAKTLPWNHALVSNWAALALGTLLGAGFAFLLWRRTRAIAAAVLAIFALVTWAPVNPVQQGIEPAVGGSLARALDGVEKDVSGRTVEVFGSYELVAQVRAAGFESLSGTTLYPDSELMEQLVPAQRDLWNNYAQYLWSPAPEGATPRIGTIKGTLMSLTISPCDPTLLETAKPDLVVSTAPLSGSCLVPIGSATSSEGEPVQLFRVRTD